MAGMRWITLALAALVSATAPAAGAADASAVGQAVTGFLDSYMRSLPGNATYTVGRIGAERLSNACDGYDVGLEATARPWGRTQVAVRCRGAGWKLMVPVQIRVVAEYLVAAQPIAAGQKLLETDIGSQNGELSEIPGTVLLDRQLAIGRTAIGAIPAGRPLRPEMLRQPMAVLSGQTVKVVGTGTGFQVTNEGRAMGNAAVGQVAQVRLNSGQVVSGIVRADGAIEIRF